MRIESLFAPSSLWVEEDLACRLSVALKLTASAVLAALVIGVTLVFQHRFIPAVVDLFILGSISICFLLARRGKERAGAWLLIASCWAVTTVISWFSGGFANTTPIFYIVLTLGAGWLLGSRAVILWSAVSFVSAAVMAVVESSGRGLPHYFGVEPYAALFSFGLALLLVAAPFAQVLRSLDSSRKQDRERLAQLKLAEGALESSEARHRSLFTFLGEAVFVADVETGMILDANPAAEALIGRSLQEIQTLHQTQLHPPERQQSSRQGFAEHVRRPGGVFSDSEVLHRDGRRIPVEIASTLLKGSDGRPVLIGIFRDATGRKKAEEALRRSEERFRQVAESAGEFIWEVDARGLYRYASTAVEKILGYAPEELVGKRHWFDLLAPESRDEASRVFDLFAHKEPFRGLLTPVVGKDGRRVVLRSSGMPLLDAEGTLIGYCGADADVTEQKRAEDALRDSEARLYDAAKLANIGYSTWDPATDATEWSEQMYQIFGRDPARPCPSYTERAGIYTQESWKRLQEIVVRALSTGSGYDVELDIVRPGGEIRHTHARGAPVLDAGGKVISLRCALQDITERKQAENRLRQTQWAESFRALGRGIAHDFNNLLGAILAEAEGALMESRNGGPGTTELHRIETLARRASEIVRQLMIYSGHERPAVEPVDVSALVEEILELLRSTLSKSAALRVDLRRDLRPVMADATQLRQVILNLVLNAAEAIGNGKGEIGVTTSRATLKNGDCADRPEGEYIRLEVSDTGCGMTSEIRAKIFDPFFSTKADGRGLGLPVVLSVVKAIGGLIQVTSSPGDGSHFEILLPCSGEEPRDRPPVRRSIPQPTAATARTVLIVEDEDILRLATSRILAKRGFTVIQAADGGAAVEQIRSERGIDWILLDVTIPGLSSREVVAQAAIHQPAAKTVLTTAYSPEMVMDSFEGARISGFIRKPYRLNDVIETLQES